MKLKQLLTIIDTEWVKENPDTAYELIEEQDRQHKAAVDRGKKRNKRIKHIETGLIFDSMTEAASYFNKSNASMSKWMKQNKLIEID